MDENSCEGETSESAENVLDGQKVKKTDDISQLENFGVKITFEDGNTLNRFSERVGSSIDASASGPSVDYSQPKLEDDVIPFGVETVAEPVTEPIEEPFIKPVEERVAESIAESVAEPVADLVTEEPVTEPVIESQQAAFADENVSTVIVPVPTNSDLSVAQPRVRLSPEVEEQQEARTITVGPPPSYSFVMKQKKKSSLKSRLPDPVVSNRPPPPTYSGNRGLFLPPEESRFERLCNLPSLSEPIWRSHSQPAFCRRCGIIILTTIHSHDSIATHVTALALCLFGCWPCCLLPYCMNVCKNTYHHCPICQSFLGAYSPW